MQAHSELLPFPLDAPTVIGMMILDLEPQELVYSFQCRWIGGRNSDPASSVSGLETIMDFVL